MSEPQINAERIVRLIIGDVGDALGYSHLKYFVGPLFYIYIIVFVLTVNLQ